MCSFCVLCSFCVHFFCVHDYSYSVFMISFHFKKVIENLFTAWLGLQLRTTVHPHQVPWAALHHLAYATEIKSIQLHDTIVMASLVDYDDMVAIIRMHNC